MPYCILQGKLFAVIVLGNYIVLNMYSLQTSGVCASIYLNVRKSF